MITDLPYPEDYDPDLETWCPQPGCNLQALTVEQCLTLLLLAGPPVFLNIGAHSVVEDLYCAAVSPEWIEKFDTEWARLYGNGYQTSKDQYHQFMVWWAGRTDHPDLQCYKEKLASMGVDYALREPSPQPVEGVGPG